MRQILFGIAAFGLMGFGAGQACAGALYTFVTIDFPGSPHNSANGVNDAGQISGGYLPNKGPIGDGFLLQAGMFTTLDFPGSIETVAAKLNASDQVVGVYILSGRHGFLYSQGNYTTIDVPGSTDDQSEGINNAGQIVGFYVDSGGATHGYLRTGGNYTPVDVPGSTLTRADGINNSSQIVGGYMDGAGATHGFLLSGSKYTTFDVPGATFTEAVGINDAGQIVGKYLDAAGHKHGFLLSGGNYTSIDVPGSVSTEVLDINNLGQLVGQYLDTDHSHGFLATPVPEPGSLSLLALASLGSMAAVRRLRKSHRVARATPAKRNKGVGSLYRSSRSVKAPDPFIPLIPRFIPPLVRILSVLLAGLAVLHAASARAGITLGAGQLNNASNFNEVNPSIPGSATNVGTPSNSLSVFQPGSYNLPFSASYTDALITSSGSAQSSMTTQLQAPQIFQSDSVAMTTTTLTPGWVGKCFTTSNDFQYFTLTNAYLFQLHEQAAVQTNSVDADAGGALVGPSGTVTLWSLAAVGTNPSSLDVTVGGLLGPGTYLLESSTKVASYSSTDPAFTASSTAAGQQTLTLTAVPEPGALVLLGTGTLGMLGYGWRRKHTGVKAAAA
jgi:hypothetical protein